MSFDRVARVYRWLEYGSFGPLLARCRHAGLDPARGAARALVIGDGDGRFTASLLAAEPAIEVDSIDASAAMQRLAKARAQRYESRVHFYQADALACEHGIPPGARYDFVATHFFLDCLSSDEVNRLAAQLRPRLLPGARWVVSEFATPNLVTGAIVRLLYLAFRFAAALRVQQLPDYESALAAAGFACTARRTWAGGLLVTSCWRPGEQPHAAPATPMQHV